MSAILLTQNTTDTSPFTPVTVSPAGIAGAISMSLSESTNGTITVFERVFYDSTNPQNMA